MTNLLVGGTDPATQALSDVTWDVQTCGSAEGLAAIARPEISLVLWRRSLPQPLTDWLARLRFDRPLDLRVVVPPGAAASALAPLARKGGLPGGAGRDLLLADIDTLADRFAAITRTGFVAIRLSAIDHDACWRFHRDYVAGRLIVTYRGPGTEWVSPSLGERALREQGAYRGPLERMDAGDVAIFKGCRADPAQGLVHRSPPILGLGVTRLLLVLNTDTGPARLDSVRIARA